VLTTTRIIKIVILVVIVSIGFCLTDPISLCLDSFVFMCVCVFFLPTVYVLYYCNTVRWT